MNGREVWVTGVGVVSAAGIGVTPLLRLLFSGDTAVRVHQELGGRCAARAPTPSRERWTHRLDRSALLFFTAAEEAWLDAGLSDVELDPRRCGVIEGSSLGPLADVLTEHAETKLLSDRQRPRPSRLIRFMTGAGGAALAQSRGLRGPVFHLSAGSVSASCAIGEAFQKIALGAADLVVAGGAECPLHPEVVESFAAAGILAGSNGGESTCRPFDTHRCGTVLGEGAGALILEASDHAARRGARPRAVVTGFGLSCEGYGMTAPDPEGTGVAEAVRQALAERDTKEVGWIKTHGTGTRLNDAAECHGLATVLGNRLPNVPLTSLKPTLGHCLGASGAVEGVASVLALESSLIPPTCGTIEVDPSLPRCAVATRATVTSAKLILLLAESFGGRCAALALRRTAKHVRS